MTCAEATRLIGPWLDDELDVRSVVDIETHVARCAACDRERSELLALRQTARAGLPHPAPPRGLVVRLLGLVRLAAVSRPRPARRWVREAALMLAAAGVAVAVTSSIPRGAVPSDDAVDAHLRSLQPGHLTDVASSDQHTVKPWFQGRVDFAVPARDFTAQGFELVGGRLDVVGGRPVAALVYRRRQHLLNLFVWTRAPADPAPRSGSSRGYRVSRWTHDGLEYALVADVPAAEADQLAALLRGA
jgi:anti-sigma factor RsiW